MLRVLQDVPDGAGAGRTQEETLRWEPRQRVGHRVDGVGGRQLEPQGVRSEPTGDGGVSVGCQPAVRGHGGGGGSAEPDGLQEAETSDSGIDFDCLQRVNSPPPQINFS